jgi:hypothetical protein
VSEYGEYEVTGRREYRGHKPGTRFEANLERAAEQRAVDRGDIRLLRRFTPDLEDGSWTLPDPWPPGRPTVPPAPTETPHGVSLIEGGGKK